MTMANASVLAVKIGKEAVCLVTVADVMCGLSNEKSGLETNNSSLAPITPFPSCCAARCWRGQGLLALPRLSLIIDLIAKVAQTE